jgi:hypothetical protein
MATDGIQRRHPPCSNLLQSRQDNGMDKEILSHWEMSNTMRCGGCSSEATWVSAGLQAERFMPNSGLQTRRHAGLPGLERLSYCGS